MSRPLRMAVLLVLTAAVVWLLFSVVFPWVDATFVTDPVLSASLRAHL